MDTYHLIPITLQSVLPQPENESSFGHKSTCWLMLASPQCCLEQQKKQFNPLKSDKSNYQVIKIDFAQRVVCAMSQAGLCLCYVCSPAKCGAMLVCHHWQTHICHPADVEISLINNFIPCRVLWWN